MNIGLTLDARKIGAEHLSVLLAGTFKELQRR
jgi:hypothetical protein